MTDQTEQEQGHSWCSASTVDLTEKQAALARRRGSIRLAEQIKISCLEIYCKKCRRPWDDVFDEPCVESEHLLRGGPIGKRRKRGHEHHDCDEHGCDPSADTGRAV